LKKERTEVVMITDSAVQAIKSAMADESKTPDEAYLRVGVKGGGCSGFSYDLKIATEKHDGDLEIEKDGVRLLIDLKSQVYLAGSTLDFTSGLNGNGFVFVNPNATGTCGCGDSFSV
jgi:iron-sulfur cluster assembly protein